MRVPPRRPPLTICFARLGIRRIAVVRAGMWLALAAFASSLSCGGGKDATGPIPALDLSKSTLSVASGPYISGQQYSATFAAKDQNGNIYATTVDAQFSLTGGASNGTFAAVTSNGSGGYATTFTATTAGSASTLNVIVGGASIPASQRPSVTVVPGAVSAAQSAVTAATASAAIGAAVTLTLTARDAAGNSLTTGGLAVVFTKGAGTSDGTLSATTDNGNGTYSATFTATVIGSARTIGATIGGVAVSSALPAITVLPGPVSLAQSVVSVSATSAPSGAAVTLTLTARDAAGNALTTGGLVVVFNKTAGTSDGTIVAPMMRAVPTVVAVNVAV